ncbi:hypothetical protein MYX07_06535 [Patescibacteria group bacterium AH-259-L07]|nr:hypothetical protein [Patescibacteria group bacterium AH-259-L07]
MAQKSIKNLAREAMLRFRINKIREAYRQFSQEIERLKELQNTIINEKLQQIDQQKIQKVLNKLK